MLAALAGAIGLGVVIGVALGAAVGDAAGVGVAMTEACGVLAVVALALAFACASRLPDLIGTTGFCFAVAAFGKLVICGLTLASSTSFFFCSSGSC